MNRRILRSAIACATSLSLALAPSVAMAKDDAPNKPMEVRGSSNSVGQSVQIRTDADGNPNSAVTSFRWSVTQISAQGEPGAKITVQVPEQGLLLHNLQRFGLIKQENGQGQFNIKLDDNGYGTARSVSLVPPKDFDLPVEIKAEFTLDGKPVKAQELVGKSGVVTAKYTVTNKTRKSINVPIKSVTGDEIEKSIEADVPMVVEALTLLPDRYAGLNTGTGLGGADGRGNTQVKWIALPFSPLSKDGSASFGWAARVTNAEIPAMLVQVLPLYIPKGDGEKAPEDAAEDAKKLGLALGVNPPNVKGDITAIKGGIEQVLAGIATLTEDDGSGDPLQNIGQSLNNFFEKFGADLTTVASLVDPNNPEGATALVKQGQEAIAKAQEAIDTLESSGALDKLNQLATVLTPELAKAIQTVGQYGDVFGKVAEIAPTIQQIVDNSKNIIRLIKATCIKPPPDLQEICKQKDLIIKILEDERLAQAAEILNSDAFQTAARILSSEEFKKLASIMPEVQQAVAFLNTNLPGILTSLKAVLPPLSGVLGKLEGALTGLSGSIGTIAQAIGDKEVDLPTVDVVVSQVVSKILASPGGQQVTAGLEQIGTGAAGVKSELGTFASSLVVALTSATAAAKEAIASGKDTAAVLIDKADTLKAEAVGLVASAHNSPLPYGGDPATAPVGTKLAGAYEFRMDPADREAPSTLPRILLGLLLLLAAGYAGSKVLTSRRAATAGAAGAGLPYVNNDAGDATTVLQMDPPDVGGDQPRS